MPYQLKQSVSEATGEILFTMITLGIETSCDETSVALLEDDSVIDSEVYSQTIHAEYGGVVPELASRAHIAKIDVLTKALLNKNSMTVRDLDLIAVTDSPGLAGALLVGISFGLGLHSQSGIPITGVNHLEGHMYSLFCEKTDLTYPFLALLVSGGHTAIYHVEDFGSYTLLGQTVDDAAGEAFDKIGKLLGFAYPAGRAIELESQKATPENLIPFPIAKVNSNQFDFSFSGLKTAVKYYCQKQGDAWVSQHIPALCMSFQKTIIDSLTKNIVLASNAMGIDRVGVAGGVACNGALRRALADHFGTKAYFPAPKYCTDNAAMIGRAGFERLKRNMTRFPHMNPSSGL
jgi:N6-L-threonylcarbamoyladenine synthase